MKIEIKLTDDSLHIEDVVRYSHDNDAGADIIIQEDIILTKGTNKIPLGFSAVLPSGVAGFIFPRSSIMGLGLQFNLAPVDPDYSGVWHMILYNPNEELKIPKGTRLCQIVLMPIIQATFVKELSNKRSSGGIGSTGK